MHTTLEAVPISVLQLEFAQRVPVCLPWLLLSRTVFRLGHPVRHHQTSAEMPGKASTIFIHLCRATLTSAVAVISKGLSLFVVCVLATPVLDRLAFLSARLTEVAV